MNKVIIFNPRSASSAHRLPYAILHIGASIQGLFDYVFVDGNLETNPLATIKKYLDTGEYVYFASTVMPGHQTLEAIPFTKHIKQQYPEVTTIWGGYFPTMYYESVMKSGFVDYVIHGIGDKAFPALLQTLEKLKKQEYAAIQQPVVLQNKTMATAQTATTALNLETIDNQYVELKKIKNLIFLNKDEIIKNQVEHKLDYSQLNPFPFQHLNTFYPLQRYMVHTFLGTRTSSYHSSMGCPFSCNFCAIVPMFNSRLSVQVVEEVYRNIKYLKNNFGTNAIEFNDNEFFYSEQRVAQLSQLLKGENIAWWAYGRIDILNRYSDATLLLMQESGCKMIFFGAEGGDTESLRKVNKGGSSSVDMAVQLLDRLKRFNIVPEYSFVVGLPAPTPQLVEKQIHKDLMFVKAIKKLHPDTEIILNFYRPIPIDESDSYRMAVGYGYKFPDNLEEWLDPSRKIHTFAPVKHFAWFPERAAKKVKNFVTVLHAYHPSVSDFQLTRFHKFVLRLFSFWRYHLNFYHYPYELKLLQKIWRYKRPEEEGFYAE